MMITPSSPFPDPHLESSCLHEMGTVAASYKPFYHDSSNPLLHQAIADFRRLRKDEPIKYC